VVKVRVCQSSSSFYHEYLNFLDENGVSKKSEKGRNPCVSGSGLDLVSMTL
jgi:hypothetical protein